MTHTTSFFPVAGRVVRDNRTRVCYNLPMANHTKKDSVDLPRLLEIYATEGAVVAAKAGGISVRTMQRWAAQEGVGSGYKTPVVAECPSAASYGRGCRCEGCIEANRIAAREAKERRIARSHKGAEIPHGVSGYSNWDCRCLVCSSAWAAYLRQRRAARAIQRTPEPLEPADPSILRFPPVP